MEVKIPFTDRSRRFGYLIWPKRMDADMSDLLDRLESIEVMLDDDRLGSKRVDWKYRRISLGPRRTRALDEKHDCLGVSVRTDGVLCIRPCSAGEG